MRWVVLVTVLLLCPDRDPLAEAARCGVPREAGGGRGADAGALPGLGAGVMARLAAVQRQRSVMRASQTTVVGQEPSFRHS